jgi:UDP-N-acetylglucosamine 4,6-dehydratase
MNYFITGGTGSIGKEIVSQLLTKGEKGKIVVYSRDEAKQAKMAETFPEGGASGIRYIVGDITDYDRLVYAMRDADVVIHAAAMKRIDTCEYNPMESVRVNVLGTINVARAVIECSAKGAVFISTDKACNPCSAYGAQKAAVERMWIGMNNMTKYTCFNVVRYGNVYGSRGSIINRWTIDSAENKPLNITSTEMTRFFWYVSDAAKFIISRIADISINFDRGLVYVPKMRAHKMIDIAMTISKNIQVTGLRCPEKLHEELISETEGLSTWDQDDHYIIYPMQHDWSATITARGVKIEEGFSLSSKI